MPDTPDIVHANGSTWHVSWHPGDTAPAGTPHGATGICFVDDGRILLVSSDGANWGFPGGRTEPGETWRDTLDREVLEEAGATVTAATLLGFARSHATAGPERGTVLVRSFWRATVTIEPDFPRFEIPFRRLVDADDAPALIPAAHTDGSAPILLRILESATRN